MIRVAIIYIVLTAVGLASSERSPWVGIYAPESSSESRLELQADGRFSIEGTGEVRLWFLAGQWKIESRILILSWGEEIARYSIGPSGDLVLSEKKKRHSLESE